MFLIFKSNIHILYVQQIGILFTLYEMPRSKHNHLGERKESSTADLFNEQQLQRTESTTTKSKQSEGWNLRPQEKFTAKNKTRVKTWNAISNIMKEILKGSINLLFTK